MVPIDMLFIFFLDMWVSICPVKIVYSSRISIVCVPICSFPTSWSALKIEVTCAFGKTHNSKLFSDNTATKDCVEFDRLTVAEGWKFRYRACTVTTRKCICEIPVRNINTLLSVNLMSPTRLFSYDKVRCRR